MGGDRRALINYNEERELVFRKVTAERDRQTKKWGRQKHSNATWNLILNEEVGEVAKAILEREEGGVTKKLIQVIAVAVAWLEDHLERGEFAPEVYGEAHTEALKKWQAQQHKETPQ